MPEAGKGDLDRSIMYVFVLLLALFFKRNRMVAEGEVELLGSPLLGVETPAPPAVTILLVRG